VDLRAAVVVHSQRDDSPSVSFEAALAPVPGATAVVHDVRITVRRLTPPTITFDLTDTCTARRRTAQRSTTEDEERGQGR
ncbi:hypothetical protein AB0G02_36800, partial [Actinosynnema sp. NPDC023658]|uniref:hypothetical protein n=1 Tax=Actinosynnema sp. NPDC023658 TaxID=3155465 RepID=UPI0033E9CC67